MAWFGGKGYDRARLLERAARARRRGREGKAIELYGCVLEHEPDNTDLHRRLAPLLAKKGRVEDALRSYRIAARSLARRGFLDHAVGVYREAAQRLPRRREVWEALAELELERGKPADAHLTLLQGARQLRSRRLRPEAVALLLRAHALEPRHFETGCALASALVRVGARPRAAAVLADMVIWARGRERRHVRMRQFLLAPSPATAWRWLAVLWGANSAGRPDPHPRVDHGM